MKRIFAGILAVVLLAALLLTGCANAAPGATTAPEPAVTEPTGGEQEPSGGEGFSLSSGGEGFSLSLGGTTSLNTQIYLSIEGRTQGAIRGNASIDGVRGLIRALDFTEQVNVPLDEETMLPKGKPVYRPATFAHASDDEASVALRRALINGEYLTVTVDFYHTASNGLEEKYYTIRYEGAVVVAIESFLDERGTVCENVTLRYDAVKYTQYRPTENSVTGKR